jgi:hypothetical protein
MPNQPFRTEFGDCAARFEGDSNSGAISQDFAAANSGVLGDVVDRNETLAVRGVAAC